MAGPVAAKPERALLRESVKNVMVASSVGCTFAMVKRRVTVSPAITGSPMNSLVKVRPATLRSSVAAAEVAGVTPIVAETLLVVLVWLPEAAPAGTLRVTLKVQLCPGMRVPSIKVSKVSHRASQ